RRRMTTVDTNSRAVAAATDSAPARPFFDTRLGRALTALVSVGLGLLIWQLLSLRVRPLFLPSPALTLQAVGELWDDGTLIQSIGASLARIMAGWSLGLLIGIPVGILMGYFSIVR